MFFSALTKPLPVSRPVFLVSVLAACLAAPAWAQSDDNDNLIPVVVTASRIEQSQKEAIPSTTVITQEMIKNKQAPDVPTLLRNEAGINITRSGGAGTQTSLFMRGAESGQVLILIDGVALRNPSSTGTPIELQHLLPEQIERIEIVRGNVSAIYGSGAIGGVIQIFTKRGEGLPSITASAEAGSHRTNKLSAGLSGQVDGTRYSLSATRYKTNGFSAMRASQDPGVNGDSDGNRDISVNAAISNEWSKGHELGVRVYGYDAKTYYDALNGPTIKDWQESKQWTFAGFTKNRITSDWLSTVTASHTSFNRDVYYSPQGAKTEKDADYRGETSMLQWNNEYAMSPDWVVTGGADIQREKGVVRAYRWGGSYFDEARTNYDVYAGVNGKIGSHSLQANVRYDHVDESGSDTTGYLGYGYDLTSSWKLIASASTAFLAPTIFQQYQPIYGNKDLEAEKSRSFEGGIQYASGKTLVRATLFETRTHDLISFHPVNYQNINVNRAKNKGFELNGFTQLAGVDIRGNLMIQDPVDRETGKALVRRAKKIANLDVSKTWGNWYVGGDVHYERHRPDVGTLDLGSYAIVNFNVRYQVTKEVYLFGRVENMLDKDYQTAYGYEQGDRAFFAGVNWKM